MAGEQFVILSKDGEGIAVNAISGFKYGAVKSGPNTITKLVVFTPGQTPSQREFTGPDADKLYTELRKLSLVTL